MDIVIPYHPKDSSTIKLCIESIHKYVKQYKNIYIVSHKNHNISTTIWKNLDCFPFKGEDIEKIYTKQNNKQGWYLQQLIKLYAVVCIPNITETIVIIDSDTVFCNDIYLYNDTINKPNLNILHDLTKGRPEYHKPYFNHMKQLHPSLKRMNNNISGMSHVFAFKKKIVLDLFKLVEDYDNTNKKFWEIFLLYSNTSNHDSAASEFEIMINFILLNYKQEYNNVKWKFGIAKINKQNVLPDEKNINYYKNKLQWNYIIFQSHMRGVREFNYKNICTICGIKNTESHICDELNTNYREKFNII